MANLRFERVRDVLDHVKAFHRQLHQYYIGLEREAEKQRVAMLLSYLGRHQKHLEECLEDYEESAASKVLNAWFKYAPDMQILKFIANTELKPDMTTDQVVKTALQYDDKIINFYREMTKNAESVAVKEVFESLLQLESREKLRVARNALILEDI